MNFIIRHSIWFVVVLLFTANIIVFVSGVRLSDEIMNYDNEIKRLRQENLDLEKNSFDVGSLQYASSIAAELRYTEKAQPIYLDNLKFARNNQ